jgi:hypothetical protein
MEPADLPTNNDDDNEQASINLRLLSEAALTLSDALSAEGDAKYSLNAIKEYEDRANIRLQESCKKTSTALARFKRANYIVTRSINNGEEREREREQEGGGESTEGKVVVSKK